MLRIFTGYDEREAVGWNVFATRILKLSKDPVSLIPLGKNVTKREGTNAFTYARFLVPYFCNWQGRAIFVDGCDMLCKADPAEMFEYLALGSPLAVARHEYSTGHSRKYIGTELEAENKDYPGKNQSSVMAFDCAHFAHRALTPEYVNKASPAELHSFQWIKQQERIGELPLEWNWLADEYGVNENAKLLHWTAGTPAFQYYHDTPHAEDWRAAWVEAMQGLQYEITIKR